MEEREKVATKPANPENDTCRICEYILTLSMELENRSILIAGFAGSRWRHRRINTLQTQTSEPVHMLELFKEPQTCNIHLN